jgi:hypothetical protein
MNPMPTNRRPPAAVPQAEETAYKRRMAICAFSDPTTLARLTQSLQAEMVALSSVVAGQGQPDRAPLPVFAEVRSGESGWSDFLETVRLQTSPAIAHRLAGEFPAGYCLLVIVLNDAIHEARILQQILANGALSVQIHDLSA